MQSSCLQPICPPACRPPPRATRRCSRWQRSRPPLLRRHLTSGRRWPGRTQRRWPCWLVSWAEGGLIWGCRPVWPPALCPAPPHSARLPPHPSWLSCERQRRPCRASASTSAASRLGQHRWRDAQHPAPLVPSKAQLQGWAAPSTPPLPPTLSALPPAEKDVRPDDMFFHKFYSLQVGARGGGVGLC